LHPLRSAGGFAVPFCEADPWRMQYFEGIASPPELRIPTEDPDAYEWYPQQAWVYDKLRLCASQGITCAPHGVEPPEFPVFSKPITNLRGMGVGSRVLHSPADYRRYLMPGHFWMPLLQGDHVSTDVAVVQGRACWSRHSWGIPAGEGMFDYWTIEAARRPALETYLADWLERYIGSYTGMMNFESIGGRIIDAHLRFADQWPDLYGRAWLEAVVALYQHGAWRFDERGRTEGYSLALFGPHGRTYHHPAAALVERVRRMPQVSSVQITFHTDRPAAAHPMPPGGFRLAIVNCHELDAGKAARAVLAQAFDV
jgi:hypothetical protein